MPVQLGDTWPGCWLNHEQQAAISTMRNPDDAGELTDRDGVFDVNVFGLFDVTRAVLPGMRAQGSETIVNVSSVGGRLAYLPGTPYHATKWSVEGASEAMHFEVLTLGTRVRLVEPGGVNTDFSGRSFVFDRDRR